MTSAGELNRRLTLEAPVESNDGAGGVVRGYLTVTTLWAQVTPVSVRSDVAADSLGAALRFRVVIRKRDDVTLRHRLVEGARVYRLVAVRESADRRFLEIETEMRTD